MGETLILVTFVAMRHIFHIVTITFWTLFSLIISGIMKRNILEIILRFVGGFTVAFPGQEIILRPAYCFISAFDCCSWIRGQNQYLKDDGG